MRRFAFVWLFAMPAACGAGPLAPEPDGGGGRAGGPGLSGGGAGGTTGGGGGAGSPGGGRTGSGGAPGGGAGAGAAGGGAGGGAAGGSAGLPGGGLGGGGGAEPATGGGYVSVGSFSSGGSMPMGGYYASAGFSRGDGCQVQPAGPCAVIRCDGPAGAPLGAGTISIGGGAAPVTLAPDTAGVYTTAMGEQPLWQGGERITIAGTGDPAGVPGFSAALVAPAPVVGTTVGAAGWPSEPGQSLAVPRGAPLQVAWMAGGAGMVGVSVETMAGPLVSCLFPAGAGSGAVPAEALGALPAGSAFVVLVSLAEQETLAGPYPVSLALVTQGRTATGAPTYAEATLQ